MQEFKIDLFSSYLEAKTRTAQEVQVNKCLYDPQNKVLEIKGWVDLEQASYELSYKFSLSDAQNLALQLGLKITCVYISDWHVENNNHHIYGNIDLQFGGVL